MSLYKKQFPNKLYYPCPSYDINKVLENGLVIDVNHPKRIYLNDNLNSLKDEVNLIDKRFKYSIFEVDTSCIEKIYIDPFIKEPGVYYVKVNIPCGYLKLI
jgi:hypothetical protein